VTLLLDQTNTFPGIVLRTAIVGRSRPALLEFDLPTETEPEIEAPAPVP
jgi:hypothetical protein